MKILRVMFRAAAVFLSGRIKVARNLLGRQRAVVNRDLVDFPFESQAAAISSLADIEKSISRELAVLEVRSDLTHAVDIRVNKPAFPNQCQVMPGLGRDRRAGER